MGVNPETPQRRHKMEVFQGERLGTSTNSQNILNPSLLSSLYQDFPLDNIEEILDQKALLEYIHKAGHKTSKYKGNTGILGSPYQSSVVLGGATFTLIALILEFIANTALDNVKVLDMKKR